MLESYSDSQEFQLVEVGAGTGKFTRAALRVLAERGVDNNVKVISTEPMKEMCGKFREIVTSNVEIRERPAHDLGKGLFRTYLPPVACVVTYTYSTTTTSIAFLASLKGMVNKRFVYVLKCAKLHKSQSVKLPKV